MSGTFYRYTVICDGPGHPKISQSCSSMAEAQRVKTSHDGARHAGADTARIEQA